ncbi:MAG: flagellar assembly protein FliW [Verrucomicrobiota bacterium]
MKYDTENPALEAPTLSLGSNEFYLPNGLVGFPEINHVDVIYDEEELPFMWLRSNTEMDLSFIVIQPNGIVDDYSVELMQADVDELEIKNSEEVMVLNIVIIKNESGGRKIFTNLVGPIIVNRRTGVGKQVIIQNYEDYSARHLLYDESADDGGEEA